MILRDEQVSRAVVIVIAGDDGARILELDLVEADIGGHVFETVRAEIAEETDFAFAVFGFADSGEIDPAVVVVVDGGYAVGADPVGLWEFYPFEGFAVVVAPESDAGRADVRESKVHPSIVVEVENSDSICMARQARG